MSSGTFVCNLCRKRFKQQRYLKYHVVRCIKKVEKKRVAPKSNFSCTMCGKEFLYLSQLQRHQMAHFGATNFDCPSCSRQFVHKTHLERHMVTVHRDQTKPQYPHRCNKCSNRFLTRWELNRHSKLVHPYDFKCAPCSTEDKPVKFDTVAAWQSHMKYHMKKNHFLCSHCGRSFKQKSDLIIHTAVHDKVGHFQCSICEVVFVQRVQVDRHIKKLHKNNQDLKCRSCDIKFDTDTEFFEHMKKKHKTDTVFLCKYCKEYFLNGGVYERHVQECHFKKLETPISLTEMGGTCEPISTNQRSTEPHSYCNPEPSTSKNGPETVELHLSITVVQENLKSLHLGSFLPSELIFAFPQLKTLEANSEEAYTAGQNLILKLPLLKPKRKLNRELRDLLSKPIEIVYK